MTMVYLYVYILFLTSVAYSNDVSPENCTCVPYFQCSDETGNLIVDGLGLVDVRGYHTSTCKGYFDVCCDVSKSLSETTTEHQIMMKGCGYGLNEKHPWSTYLFYQLDISTPPEYKCGGSFIHNQVVLTAAHCIEQKGIWSVHKGEITANIKKTIIYPTYNSGTLHNDIALLILDEPMHQAGVICIPPPGIILDNSFCTVGTFNNTADDTLTHLKLIDMPIVPKQICLKSLRNTRLGEYFRLHHSFLCAGGQDNKDTCGGDGGSSLVCQIPNQPGRYHQAGIVSWGIGCGENNVPGVYVNLALFRDWIDEQMSSNGFDINSYRY